MQPRTTTQAAWAATHRWGAVNVTFTASAFRCRALAASSAPDTSAKPGQSWMPAPHCSDHTHDQLAVWQAPEPEL